MQVRAIIARTINDSDLNWMFGLWAPRKIACDIDLRPLPSSYRSRSHWAACTKPGFFEAPLLKIWTAVRKALENTGYAQQGQDHARVL